MKLTSRAIGRGPAHAMDPLFWDDGEKFGLCGLIELTDFVEEEGAARSQLDLAPPFGRLPR